MIGVFWPIAPWGRCGLDKLKTTGRAAVVVPDNVLLTVALKKPSAAAA